MPVGWIVDPDACTRSREVERAVGGQTENLCCAQDRTAVGVPDVGDRDVAAGGVDRAVDILTERTARRDTRPLLRNADPRGTLERLSDERRPSYAEAHIHIKSGDGAHRDVVDAIVEALETHLGTGSPT